MPEVIVYAIGAVGCAIMSPVPGFDIKAIAEKDVPAGAAFLIVDAATLPAEAPQSTWKIVDGAVVVDAAGNARTLVAYAQTKQEAVLAAGLTVNVGTEADPVEIFASTDAHSLALLMGAASAASQNAGFTTTWISKLGSATLTASQVIAVDAAVTTFIQSTFMTLAAVLSAINATPPTITTTAQIDGAAWPAS